MSYKPYHHKAINKKRYLRKNSERHVIDKELKSLAKQYAKELGLKYILEEEKRREELEETIRLRFKGAQCRKLLRK